MTSATWSLDIRFGPFDRFFTACFAAVWREFLRLALEAFDPCLRCFAILVRRTEKYWEDMPSARGGKLKTVEVQTDRPGLSNGRGPWHQSFVRRLPTGEEARRRRRVARVVRSPPSHPTLLGLSFLTSCFWPLSLCAVLVWTVLPMSDVPKLRITLLGAGQEVGRSCCVLQYRGRTIVCDAGVHPAYNGIASLPFVDDLDWSTVDVLLVTQCVYLQIDPDLMVSQCLL